MGRFKRQNILSFNCKKINGSAGVSILQLEKLKLGKTVVPKVIGKRSVSQSTK